MRTQLGTDAPWRLPTLCWLIGAHTGALHTLAWLGIGAGLALLANVAPLVAAVVCWASYLSLAVAGQVFLNFQWDALLLETGLLGMLLAPWGLRPGLGSTARPRTLIWLCWLLVIKLNVLSGAVKLLSGDPTWRSWTALEYHYWTTCLPAWTGWWVHQLPAWVHRASVGIMLAIELIVPLGIFTTRRIRHLAAALLLLLQVVIATTGNYGFFNLLTIVLCLTLLDDSALGRLWPTWRSWQPPPGPSRWRRGLAGAAAALVATLSLGAALTRVGAGTLVPTPLSTGLATIRPLRSLNAYGLFASMTTVRPEIVIEGTLDGSTWVPYDFRWKPGEPTARPRFVQPHMPRLDWQMWFAALQGYRRTYWFPALQARLLDGSPAVLDLLAVDPFDGRRPRAVRARLYRYEFTDRAERARSGAWWQRELVGDYAPVRRRPGSVGDSVRRRPAPPRDSVRPVGQVRDA